VGGGVWVVGGVVVVMMMMMMMMMIKHHQNRSHIKDYVLFWSIVSMFCNFEKRSSIFFRENQCLTLKMEGISS
jgi:hypothetical protein